MLKRQLTMRQIKEVLRQYWHLGHNKSQIARATHIPRSTVNDYIIRAAARNLKWPLPEALTEELLHQQLFYNQRSDQIITEPNWSDIHKELKRKGVTRQLLWQEYKKKDPNGRQYSWFADKYRDWAKTHKLWMHQPHKAGEEVYVDFSGLTVAIWDVKLSEVLFNAEVFVGVLGASDLIYCCACIDQKLSSWIEVHCTMFEFYGGVSDLIIPDNLRSGVTQSHRYEPTINRTYEEMAVHYNCAIMPARSIRPKDKSKAEKSVQTIQRKILAPVRDKQFTSIEQLNEHIAVELEQVNQKNFQKLPYSRQSLFDELEKSVLTPLPETRYVMAHWSRETLNGGYHVCIDHHYYSIPYHYVGKKIDIRVTRNIIECFSQEQRIACHERRTEPQEYTTLVEHMPESHRQQSLWTEQRLISWSQGIGVNAHALISKIMSNKYRNKRQCERSALGILRLSHAYSEERLEAACQQALSIGTERYDSLQSLLKKRLESKSYQQEQDDTQLTHENLRGHEYYH